MYAKIASTRWTRGEPARSCVAGTSSEYAFEFTHEAVCPMQGQPPQAPPLDCTCYVSRIRLVKTPVGEFIPTTEPDLRTEVKFWHNEAERLQRHNNIIWTGLLFTSVTGLIALAGLVFELGLL